MSYSLLSSSKGSLSSPRNTHTNSFANEILWRPGSISSTQSRGNYPLTFKQSNNQFHPSDEFTDNEFSSEWSNEAFTLQKREFSNILNSRQSMNGQYPTIPFPLLEEEKVMNVESQIKYPVNSTFDTVWSQSNNSEVKSNSSSGIQNHSQTNDFNKAWNLANSISHVPYHNATDLPCHFISSPALDLHDAVEEYLNSLQIPHESTQPIPSNDSTTESLLAVATRRLNLIHLHMQPSLK